MKSWFKYASAMAVMAAMALVATLYINCSGKFGSSGENSGDAAAPNPVTPTVAPDVVLKIDSSGTIGTINPYIFGLNIGWTGNGDKIIESGDMLRDRSFRLALDADHRQWVPSLWSAANGVIVKDNSVGDATPTGGNSIPGSMKMSQTADGYTCLDQVLLDGVQADSDYQLNFSSMATSGTPKLLAFFADTSVMPISLSANPVSDRMATTLNSWTRHTKTLRPSVTSIPAYFRLCLATAGTAYVDEVRLNRRGLEPTVKVMAKTRLQELRVKGIRFGGSSMNTYFWKNAIGPRLLRAEFFTDLKNYETPAYSLHEFLNLCEELQLAPLMEINVLDTAGNAADLIDYILSCNPSKSGCSATAMGNLRLKNGRPDPWNVNTFEIGNEPATSYGSGTNYAVLAKAISSAVRARATTLNKVIFLGGVVEAGFISADWIANTPLIGDWNPQVYVNAGNIKGNVDFVHGHFYPYNSWDADEATRFRLVMSGGEVLRKNIATVRAQTGGLPLGITEFHVDIAKPDTDEKQVEFFKDFQSGLAIGQMYHTMINQNLAGAQIFNFSGDVGYGITRDPDQFFLRPAGLAFSLFSVSAGDTLINTTATGASTISIATGVGIIPSNTNYSSISAFASKDSAGNHHIFILSSEYVARKKISLQISGFTPISGKLISYVSGKLSEHNENLASNVGLVETPISVANTFEITIEPHSMVRVDLK